VKIFRRIANAYIDVRELIPLTLLIVLSVVFYVVNPAFLSKMNISNMFAYIPELGLIALGMTLLLTAGQLDLSVGSMFGFIPVLMFTFYNKGVMGIEVSFFVVLGVCVFIGLINGLLVTKIKIHPFLVTIGMMQVIRGTGLYISQGFPQSSWQTESILRYLLAGTFTLGEFKIHASIIWFIVIIGIMYYIFKHTRFGNWIAATGGNEKAAQARGINTDRVKIILFIITSVLAGLAGIIDAFRISSAYPIAGTGYELEIIAMTVIGGTLLFGGRGTIFGTVLGVILLRSIRTGIIVIGVPGMAYQIFVGAIIIIMVAVHATIERKTTGGE
jgi:simple sugar transport system permease protein